MSTTLVDDDVTRTTPRGTVGFRNGVVSAVDAGRGLVRVRFPDRDNLESWWLSVVHRRTRADQDYDLPDIDDQVVCLMDGLDEDGAVLGAIYSDEDEVPDEARSADVDYRRYSDGTVTLYDRAAHLMRATFNDGAEIKYDAESHQFSLTLPSNGTATVDVPDGSVTVNARDASVNTDSSAKVTTQSATVEASTVDVTAPAINLNGLVTVT